VKTLAKTVPKEWKNGQISAIFKKGNKSQAKNYRPVSLTSVVCKIMEKCLLLATSCKKILYPTQNRISYAIIFYLFDKSFM
jgi:hypothetical protein